MLDVMSGRADGVRVPARHRAWSTGRTRARSTRRRRAPGSGSRSTSSAGLDRGRADPLRRRLLHLPLPQPVAEAVPEAAAEVLHRRHRQRGDGVSSRSTTTWATRSCSSPIANQLRAFARLRELADERGQDGRPGRPDHRRHGLRRRHRRGGGARGAAAHRELLQLVPPRDAEVPRPARLRHDGGVPAPRLRRRDGAGAPRRAGTTWSTSVASRAARRTPSPTRSSSGARKRACGRVNVVLENGDMPEWKTVKNMTMFAEEVIPRIRARLGGDAKTADPRARAGRGRPEMAAFRRGAPRRQRDRHRRAHGRRRRAARLPPRRRHGDGLRRAAPARRAFPADRPAPPRLRCIRRRPERRQRSRLRRCTTSICSTCSGWRRSRSSVTPWVATWRRRSRSSRRGACVASCSGRRSGCVFASIRRSTSSASPTRRSRRTSSPTCRSSPVCRSPPPPEFLADRYRESTSFARLAWHRPYDLKLAKWLHRITMPTLILWGEADRLIPVGQAAVWAGHIPGAEVRTLPGVGHLLFNEARDAVALAADFAGAA